MTLENLLLFYHSLSPTGYVFWKSLLVVNTFINMYVLVETISDTKMCIKVGSRTPCFTESAGLTLTDNCQIEGSCLCLNWIWNLPCSQGWIFLYLIIIIREFSLFHIFIIILLYQYFSKLFFLFEKQALFEDIKTILLIKHHATQLKEIVWKAIANSLKKLRNYFKLQKYWQGVSLKQVDM